MKKLIALLLVATVAGALASGPALAKKKKTKKTTKQDYAGSIMLPAPYAADGSCFFRLERLTAVYGADAATGMVGAHFDVDPATVGQKFELHLLGGSADADLDIAFYAGYGDPTDPTTAPANVGFEEREPGGETGVIPPGMSKAIICMPTGQNAEFHYTTG